MYMFEFLLFPSKCANDKTVLFSKLDFTIEFSLHLIFNNIQQWDLYYILLTFDVSLHLDYPFILPLFGIEKRDVFE